MRLSEWRAKAPFKNSVSPKVVAVIESALAVLGGERDPECWVVWGDDPVVRYLLLAPTPTGLIELNVRVNVPGEGPRAGGKVVRWNRVQLGELAVEIQGGHRLVTFQVETQVLSGADGVADRIAEFAVALFAAVDGRVAWTSGTRAAPRKAAQENSTQGKAAQGKTAQGKATQGKAAPARSAPPKAAAAKPSPSSTATGRSATSTAPSLAASKGSRS
jgi:hypothetical protein